MLLNDIPEKRRKKGSAPVGFELTILDTEHRILGGLSPIVQSGAKKSRQAKKSHQKSQKAALYIYL